MESRKPLVLPLWVFMVLLLMAVASSYAQGEESSKSENDSFEIATLWRWPFNNVIQPFLNGLIYPIAKPIDYAFKNGVIEKSVELITFGENRNILIYPSFNFKPGSQTLVGLNYRHRRFAFDKDYLVLQGSYFANGDVDFTARYTKQNLLGSDFFVGFRYDIDLDRDHSFTIPETKISYLEPDSSYSLTWRFGHPLSKSLNLNAELWMAFKFIRYSHPDVVDSVLISDSFPIEDRGLYQNYRQIPLGIAVSYDDTDFPYAPSRGTRAVFSAVYNLVGEYSGLRRKNLGLEEMGMKTRIEDGGLEHDFITMELILQRYFYLGQAKNYILSANEARKNRKFYTDFSWDETMRIWRPENVKNTLFERRVIALQYRLVDLWEMEEGGAPNSAFISVNARTPLRGYGDRWSTHHLMALSAEYRWPVDRFVDGVLFNEYALIAPEIDEWSFGHYYNSWGFGVRVRMPNMYLFRLQFGFHGLHGVNLIMTIAPEFK